MTTTVEHVTTVRPVAVAGQGWRYYAGCGCGWTDRTRLATADMAAEAGRAHVAQVRTPDAFRQCDAAVVVAQLGHLNVLSISGGRVERRETGVTLPVGNGYSVTVDYAAGDTYTVRRVFTRAGRVWVKGQASGVYGDEVGEQAYRASCFRNGPWSPDDGIPWYADR